MDHFYGVTPHRSGVYHFETKEALDAFIEEMDGTEVPAAQVDPEIRAHFEG